MYLESGFVFALRFSRLWLTRLGHHPLDHPLAPAASRLLLDGGVMAAAGGRREIAFPDTP